MAAPALTILKLLTITTILYLNGCSVAYIIRRTRCLEKFPVINRTELILNGTGHGGEIICEVFGLKDFDHNITACNTSYTNGITVEVLLNVIPRSTECIKINVENIWYGYLPLEPYPINISAVSRFPNLTCFVLAAEYGDYFQLYPLIGKPNLFRNHKFIKVLSLIIPLKDYQKVSLSDILGNVTVECLDLSNIRGLTSENLVEILTNIDHGTLKYLYLRKFQNLGANGYVTKLNFFDITAKSGSFFNLTEIDLSCNAICRLSPGITKLAPNLKLIDVAQNMLTDPHNFAFISEIFTSNSIQHIIYDQQGFPKYHHGYTDTQSSRTSMSSKSFYSDFYANREDNYSSSDRTIKQWKFVTGCANSVALGNFSNMAENKIILCKFLKCIMPSYFQDSNCDQYPIFPPLKTFFNPKCMYWIEFPIGENLQRIMVAFIHLDEAQSLGIISNGIFCLRKNNLRKVYGGGNGYWTKAFKIGSSVRNLRGFTGLESITYLEIDYNNVEVNQNYIPKGHFKDTLPNLEYLDLSGNSIVFREDFELCEDSPNVEEVILRNINITRLPANIISNCTKLWNLKIGNNSLNVEGLNDLDLNDTRLAFIELASTGLSYLDIPFIDRLNAKPTIRLDLSNNPLNCNCSTAAQTFTKWMFSNKHRLHRFETYYCSGPGGVTFVDKINVDNFWQQCNTYTLQTIIESIGVTIGAVVLILITCLLIRWRWRLKYFCYNFFQMIHYFCRCFKGKLEEGELPVIWKYDAFISYCADDRFWVHSTLMKTLEDVYGFHLCIHYRDFPAGAAISTTICESMTHSREIIIVVSDYALRSGWFHFELNEALAQVDRRNKKMVVIKLGTLEKYLLDIKVAHILDNHTYLEWSENKDCHKLFWAKLVGTIYGDPQGTCLCCPYGARALGYQDVDDPQLDGSKEENDVTAINVPQCSQLVLEDGQGILKLAQNVRETASKAENFLSYIAEIMDEEELPYWAYGPMPGPLEELLEGHDILKKQLDTQAHDRVELINECLKNFLVDKKQQYAELEVRLNELQ